MEKILDQFKIYLNKIETDQGLMEPLRNILNEADLDDLKKIARRRHPIYIIEYMEAVLSTTLEKIAFYQKANILEMIASTMVKRQADELNIQISSWENRTRYIEENILPIIGIGNNETYLVKINPYNIIIRNDQNTKNIEEYHTLLTGSYQSLCRLTDLLEEEHLRVLSKPLIMMIDKDRGGEIRITKKRTALDEQLLIRNFKLIREYHDLHIYRN